MTYDRLIDYAVNAIAQILPLDHDTCLEMIKYALTLPNAEVETHLLDLLGHSEESYKFISRFLELKREEDENNSHQAKSKVKQTSKSSSPIPSITQNVKKNSAWDHSSQTTTKSNTRLKNNKDSITISELADVKPSNKLSGQQAKKTKKKNLDSLKDIEAALNELEIEKAQESVSLESSSVVKRVCNCMATRHPLFEVAPNCLNCGKIICVKEGLQPCSYCGAELLSEKEKIEIIKILNSEKENLKIKLANSTNKQVQEQPSKLSAPKKIKVAMSAGGNLWKAQEEALKQIEEESKKQRELEQKALEEKKELERQLQEIEHYERTKDVNPDLLKAQERLETLLDFQSTGAERTRIIDNASDFEMPDLSSGSMWLSPTERALQLKKQQKQLRKIQLQEKARTGRTKKVMEMVIKDGKVSMVEKHLIEDNEPDANEIKELDTLAKQEKVDQESSMIKNFWDYEKDQDKWEKPVYVFEPVSEAPNVEWKDSKVQLDSLDSNELVAMLPS